MHSFFYFTKQTIDHCGAPRYFVTIQVDKDTYKNSSDLWRWNSIQSLKKETSVLKNNITTKNNDLIWLDVQLLLLKGKIRDGPFEEALVVGKGEEMVWNFRLEGGEGLSSICVRVRACV